MPVPSAEQHDSRGTVRAELVTEMVRRTRALMANPSDRLFPLPRDSGTFTWTDAVSTSWIARGAVPRRPSEDDHCQVFRMALRTLMTARAVGDDVHHWLRQNVPQTPAEDLEMREVVLQRLQRGERPRRTPAVYVRLHVVAAADGEGGPSPSSSTGILAARTPVHLDTQAAEDSYSVPESLYWPPSGSSSDSYVSAAATEGGWEEGPWDSSPSAACSAYYSS
jgi:hypothetical protein